MRWRTRRRALAPWLLLLVAVVAVGSGLRGADAGTCAAGGGYSGDGGQATAAQLDTPFALAFTANESRLLITDSNNHCLRSLDMSTGIITTIVGTGGTSGYSSVRGPARAASLNHPTAVAVHPTSGDIYISDTGNNALRIVSAANGNITRLACVASSPGFSGNGGPATSAQCSGPNWVAFDAAGDVLFSDEASNVIRHVSLASGNMSAFAGAQQTAGAHSGDGHSAASAGLSSPQGIAYCPEGNMYFTEGLNQDVRMVTTATGNISTLAGTSGTLAAASGLAIDANGTMYVADGHRIRKYVNGTLSGNVAGNGTAGYSADGQVGSGAMIRNASGVVCDAAGNVYFCEAGNNLVRRVDAVTGVLTTVAGCYGSPLPPSTPPSSPPSSPPFGRTPPAPPPPLHTPPPPAALPPHTPPAPPVRAPCPPPPLPPPVNTPAPPPTATSRAPPPPPPSPPPVNTTRPPPPPPSPPPAHTAALPPPASTAPPPRTLPPPPLSTAVTSPPPSLPSAPPPAPPPPSPSPPLLPPPPSPAPPTPPPPPSPPPATCWSLCSTVLQSAGNFGALAATTVTSTGATTVIGDVAVSPGTSITGYLPGVLTGTLRSADDSAAAGQVDAHAAYTTLRAYTMTQDLSGADLGGLTLSPGVYKFSSSVWLTGTLTLDAQENTTAVFVFQIGSTLTTASASAVTLINGALPCNVFFVVGSSATLGTTTTFAGSIVALTSITATTSTSIQGSLLALGGAVTMEDSSAVHAWDASCTPGPPPPSKSPPPPSPSPPSPSPPSPSPPPLAFNTYTVRGSMSVSSPNRTLSTKQSICIKAALTEATSCSSISLAVSSSRRRGLLLRARPLEHGDAASLEAAVEQEQQGDDNEDEEVEEGEAGGPGRQLLNSDLTVTYIISGLATPSAANSVSASLAASVSSGAFAASVANSTGLAVTGVTVAAATASGAALAPAPPPAAPAKASNGKKALYLGLGLGGGGAVVGGIVLALIAWKGMRRRKPTAQPPSFTDSCLDVGPSKLEAMQVDLNIRSVSKAELSSASKAAWGQEMATGAVPPLSPLRVKGTLNPRMPRAPPPAARAYSARGARGPSPARAHSASGTVERSSAYGTAERSSANGKVMRSSVSGTVERSSANGRAMRPSASGSGAERSSANGRGVERSQASAMVSGPMSSGASGSGTRGGGEGSGRGPEGSGRGGQRRTGTWSDGGSPMRGRARTDEPPWRSQNC